jgi:Cu+-exporting ATPase
VGIAVCGGTDIAIDSADVILMQPGLLPAAETVMISRAVVRNIKINLFWAFAYNVLAIPLAAGVFYPLTGWLLPPAAGAAAMCASSLCVVINALRLRYIK